MVLPGMLGISTKNGTCPLHTDYRKPLAAAMGSLLARAEPGLLMVAVPFLLFPRGYLPWVALGLLVIGWVLRGIGTGIWLINTPLNRPIAVLLLMTMVGLYSSVDLGLSMPKFYGIILGLFIFFATVGNVNSERHFWLGIWMLVASIVAVLLIGLVGTEWGTYKFPVLQQIYGMVPRVIRSVQTSFGASPGFHPNEVGGTVAFLLPLPIALIFGAPLTRLRKAALGAVVLLGLGVLVLSASRSSLIAMIVAIFCLLIWRWRRAGTIIMFVMVVGLGLAVKLDMQALAGYLMRIDIVSSTSGLESLTARPEIWDRARHMIEDFPFTGIGLNTFPIVIRTLYPLFEIGPHVLIPHAHNILLQTTVDLGLGGLMGFLGLWGCTAYAGWQAYKWTGRDSSPSAQNDRPEEICSGDGPALLARQAAIMGLLAGLLSYLIFGLTDAITLGAKPTVLLWLMMGLLVSIQRITFNAHLPTPASQPVTPNSYPFLRRAVRFLLVTAWDSYWIITFALAGLGFLVVAIAISGWIP